AVTVLAAFLYFWHLSINGYANTYYSAAALAASESWKAWFFGSFDAGSFITVDKPPLSTMLMGLSVRLFGLSSLSILAPQALAGVATVVVLFQAVRRSFGPVAGLIAAVVMALTPVAVLMFRFNNPDALLALLLGYDGLSRIFGFLSGRFGIDGGGGGGVDGGGGAGFGGAAGLFRLFNSEFVGQISWLIPFAVVALLAGLIIHMRASRTDRA